jgi:hypothetical protein
MEMIPTKRWRTASMETKAPDSLTNAVLDILLERSGLFEEAVSPTYKNPDYLLAECEKIVSDKGNAQLMYRYLMERIIPLLERDTDIKEWITAMNKRHNFPSPIKKNKSLSEDMKMRETMESAYNSVYRKFKSSPFKRLLRGK